MKCSPSTGSGRTEICVCVSPQIVWLRRDLRIADNPALYHAAKAGPVIAVYILDDARAGSHAYGGASRWWSHHSLESFGKSLEAMGSRLISAARGRCRTSHPDLPRKRARPPSTPNRHYEPWWRKAQGELKGALDLQLYDANYLMPPGSVTTGSGGQYKILHPLLEADQGAAPAA